METTLGMMTDNQAIFMNGRHTVFGHARMMERKQMYSDASKFRHHARASTTQKVYVFRPHSLAADWIL